MVEFGALSAPLQVCCAKVPEGRRGLPKDGRYIVPIKASVRWAENLDLGDTVIVRLEIR